ncbi:endonuclease/exonuclease/phosphatase family protein, partial [Trifolium medium]|nr:endonuclease/exonuclease/phosphatase family protein [Trifolium medium]
MKSSSANVGNKNHFVSEYSGDGILVVLDSLDGPNLEMALPTTVLTPHSGLALFLEDVNNNQNAGGRNNREAEKLLQIQKHVGFNYEDQDGDVVVVLEKDEIRDRLKKAEWEQNNGEGYVGVCLEWGVLRTISFVVNVYSKCDLPSKRRLWNNIISSKHEFGRGNWCVVGDFNAVVVSEERRGVNLESTSTLEMMGFRSFIVDLDVIDLPILGRRYTWYNSNGSSMSRIDRILVSPEWVDSWG